MGENNKKNTIKSLAKRTNFEGKKVGKREFLEGEGKKDFKLHWLTIIIIVLLSFCLLSLVKAPQWNSFTSQGGIYGRIFESERRLIFGTENYKLFVVSTKDPRKIKSIDLNIGTVMPQEVKGNNAYVISGDTFWKIDIKKGKPVWSFTTDNSYSLVRSEFKDESIYLSDRKGSLYSLSVKSGKVNWKKDFQSSPIKDFLVLNDRVLVIIENGGGIYVNKRDGDIVGKADIDEHINCIGTFESKTVGITSSGHVIRLDPNDGKIIWRSDYFGEGIVCPQDSSYSDVFSQNDGHIFRISMNNGKTMWKKDDFGQIATSPILSPSIFGNNYILGDLDGKVWSVKGNSKTNWVFDAKFPIYSLPLIEGEDVFIGTSGSEIYKVNKLTGKVYVNPLTSKFTTSISSKIIAENEIFEITLDSKSDFINPWSEGYLEASLISPTGKNINIDGFYYDQKIWKVRFNPPEKGAWKYKLTWNDHGAIYTKNGSFTSKTDTLNTYLRISKINPKRLTLDGETIFNGVGIQTLLVDSNASGTPLDDLWVGDETSTNSVSFDRFVTEYGSKGAGFNLYRYGNMNANDSIYRELGAPSVYSNNNGKILDSLMEELRNNDIHVWYSFFHFVVPYYSGPTLSNEKILESYIRYMIARYGAYVDIWELVNEYEAPEPIKTILINIIKKYDFEDRLITTSPEDVSTPGIDIVSPHWYETEKLSDSDKVTADFIQKFNNVGRPVIFGEQGNAVTNWDETSAERMRVRLWSSFFNQGIMIFWSSSTSKTENQPLSYYFSNIYIGNTEKLYIKNLQKFTSNFPIDSKPTVYSLNNYDVRGYGLSSQDVNAGYFFHYRNSQLSTSFSLNIDNKKTGKIVWYDPESGKTIGESDCLSKSCSITSPSFLTDIAFKLVSVN